MLVLSFRFSPMLSSSDVIVLGLSILSLYSVGLYLRKKRSWKAASYPPGPKGYPIIHNLLDIPTEYPWEVYAELAKKYGAFERLYSALCS